MDYMLMGALNKQTPLVYDVLFDRTWKKIFWVNPLDFTIGVVQPTISEHWFQ